MPPRQAFGQLQWRQRQRVLDTVFNFELFKLHCPSVPDATALLDKILEKCNSVLPNISFDHASCQQLVSSLGHLRASVSEAFRASRSHVASLSVGQLDRAVCQLRFTLSEIQSWGYNIGRTAYRTALSDQPASEPSSERNVGGRPSKVADKSMLDLVKRTLAPYLNESERVLVIGRGKNRTMVLAQHLSKKRRAIYMAEPSLFRAMSLQTFMKILKIHLPFVKNPRRKTDVCHSSPVLVCKVFSARGQVFYQLFHHMISSALFLCITRSDVQVSYTPYRVLVGNPPALRVQNFIHIIYREVSEI